MPSVIIRWGKHDKFNQQYEFETEAEVNAFLHGIAEADGWDDWEQIDQWLVIQYRCPRCGSEWTEEWSCACDSECGECGCKNIEALSWEDA